MIPEMVPTNEEPMDYRYGSKWNARKRLVVEEMTEPAARTTFGEGPQLGVVAFAEPGAELPAYSLELSAAALDVRVLHYTETGSVAAQLDYQSIGEEGRLFLGDVAEWLSADDGEFHSMSSALAFRSYTFRPDGTAELRSRVTGAEAETVEQFRDVDVSDHWVDPLTWGDWDRIGLHRPTAPEQSS